MGDARGESLADFFELRAPELFNRESESCTSSRGSGMPISVFHAHLCVCGNTCVYMQNSGSTRSRYWLIRLWFFYLCAFLVAFTHWRVHIRPKICKQIYEKLFQNIWIWRRSKGNCVIKFFNLNVKNGIIPKILDLNVNEKLGDFWCKLSCNVSVIF